MNRYGPSERDGIADSRAATSGVEAPAGVGGAPIPLRKLFLGLAIVLLTIGLAGLVAIPLGVAWGGRPVLASAMVAWTTVATGCLISWCLTMVWNGPMVGLLHVTTGFVLRAGVPFVIAAVLITQDRAWQQTGLLWWTLGLYLLGLIADTWVFVRILSATHSSGPGRAPGPWELFVSRV